MLLATACAEQLRELFLRSSPPPRCEQHSSSGHGAASNRKTAISFLQVDSNRSHRHPHPTASSRPTRPIRSQSQPHHYGSSRALRNHHLPISSPQRLDSISALRKSTRATMPRLRRSTLRHSQDGRTSHLVWQSRTRKTLKRRVPTKRTKRSSTIMPCRLSQHPSAAVPIPQTQNQKQ